ncbi:MAG: aminotransferase class IV [Neisseriaceae bacterium]
MFLETIRIENGLICLEELHLARIKRTLWKNYKQSSVFKLNFPIPSKFQHGLVKCRLLYEQTVREVNFEHYQPRYIRRLKLVEAPQLNYCFKYANRSSLEALRVQYPLYDEILITQQGYLTDTTFSNIILFDGKQYVTPETCLLSGVQRQHLLARRKIQLKKIHQNDLKAYSFLFLINAMLNWENKIGINVDCIDL